MGGTNTDRDRRSVDLELAPSPDDIPSGPRVTGYGVFASKDAPDPQENDEVRLTIALAWINARAGVTRIIDRDLVVNPAWDILLDLYVNRVRGRPVSICSLCVAAQVPQTTALRWIQSLVDRGFVYRTPDPEDRRRAFINLTDTGLDRVREALDASAEGDRKLGLGRLRTMQ